MDIILKHVLERKFPVARGLCWRARSPRQPLAWEPPSDGGAVAADPVDNGSNRRHRHFSSLVYSLANASRRMAGFARRPRLAIAVE